MMTTNLRPIWESDIEDIRLLRNLPDTRKWFRNTGRIAKLDQHSWWLAHYRMSDNFLMWAAVGVDGFVVGYIGLRMEPLISGTITDTLPDEQTGAEIGWIMVKPKFRGHGIATAMIREVLLFCAAMGIETAWADVDAENAPMLKIYDRLGFRRGDSDMPAEGERQFQYVWISP